MTVFWLVVAVTALLALAVWLVYGRRGPDE